MTSIKIEGVRGWDGTYPIDLAHLNGRDHHVIKVIAGVAGGQLEDALNAGDHDVVMAIAVCALHRAGRPVNYNQFWDTELGSAELGSITLDVEQDDDALPPDLSATAETEEPAARPPSSGPSSNGSLEIPEPTLSPTGTQG